MGYFDQGHADKWSDASQDAGGHIVGNSESGGPERSWEDFGKPNLICLLYTSPSPRDRTRSRMPSSA